MYQYEFFDKRNYVRHERPATLRPSHFLGLDDIALVRSSYWAEHCLECGEPDCYATCQLFGQRADGRCKRFKYGIHHTSDFGDSPFAAEVHFLRWAKLESIVYPGSLAPAEALFNDRSWLGQSNTRRVLMGLGALGERLYPIARRQAFDSRKYAFADGAGKENAGETPTFLLQLYSYEDAVFSMQFEITDDADLVFRQSLDIAPGYNQHIVDVSRVFPARGRLRVKLYPENDASVEVALLFCELVQLKPRSGVGGGQEASTGEEAQGQQDPLNPQESQGQQELQGQPTQPTPPTPQAAQDPPTPPTQPTPQDPSTPPPALKVKCVAWDLDNTVWDGILIESEPESLELRPGVLSAIRALDQRGVIQIVVSKNTESEVLPVLDRLELTQYFVYCFVNWQAKSGNLTRAAELLNINIDTFALIDDSVFERNEVKYTLPMVRVYPETLLDPSATDYLLDLPEFDILVTAESAKRRAMYQTEAKRLEAATSTGEDHLGFLRSCQLRAQLEHPDTDAKLLRSSELLQRTNQLNLSGSKPGLEVFRDHVLEHLEDCYVMECSDRFGSYGQVLYMEVKPDADKQQLVVTEYALSCRVASKYLESALAKALLERYAHAGIRSIVLKGQRTKRNGLLIDAFVSVGFSDEGSGDAIVLFLDRMEDLKYPDIVRVE
jgi:FkbH-like protein